MFLKNPVSADDPCLLTVYRNFDENLKAMRQDALRSDASVILCTVGSNLKDCPPFGSMHHSGMTQEELGRWTDYYKRGREHEERGQFDSALTWYRSAQNIDSSYAELRFCIGNCLFRKGLLPDAVRQYALARDLDVFRFRADDSINAIIHSIAMMPDQKQKVSFCDAKTAFDSASPGGIAGQKAFLEHVHMSFEGNYILAKAVDQQMESILPQSVRVAGNQTGELLTVQDCRARMVYSDWDRHRILKHVLQSHFLRPQCAHQLGNVVRSQAVAEEVQVLADRLTQDTLQQLSSTFRDTVTAHPDDPWLHWQYAYFLSVGLHDEQHAEEYYRSVLSIFPHYAEAHNNLGYALLSQKRFGEAIPEYQKALKYAPYFEMAYSNLAAAFAFAGNLDDAVATSLKGLQYSPGSENLRFNLACMLMEQNRVEVALKHIHTVLRNNPQSERARMLLQSIGGKQ